MATFSNQTTNLSTLSNALKDLCQRFEAPGPENQRKKGKQQKEDEAEKFLDSLVNRVDRVEEALCKSTEHLLPAMVNRGQTSRMTLTELSQVLLSLHGIHTRQIQRFASILGEASLAETSTPEQQHKPMGKESPTNNSNNESSGLTPHHWLMGQPLEKVIETDNETDRASVASMRSLSFSHTPGGGKHGPSTPLTPSINGLQLSASTTKILSHEAMDLESNNTTHFSGDDDDEYSASPLVEKTRTSITESGGIESLKKKYHSESSHFEEQDQHDNNKYQGSLHNHSNDDLSGSLFRHLQDDDDELINDSRFSFSTSTFVDQDRGNSTNSPSIINRRTSEVPTDHLQEGGEDDQNVDDDDTDEVTTLCPTVVANRSMEICDIHKQQQKHSKQTLSPELVDKSKQIFRNQQQDLTGHVVVQASQASPSQTMLTMDNTMFLHDTDAISLGEETPVLDRYRIIQDDNSIGFKVLPNERGSQRKLRNAKTRIAGGENGPGDDGIPRSVKFCERVDGREDRSTVSFRKTPHPIHKNRDMTHTTMESSPLHGLDLDSETLNKENSRENIVLPKVQFTTTPRNNQKQKVFPKTPFENEGAHPPEESVKRTVAFQSPINQSGGETHRSFRRTPFQNGNEDSALRFDTSELDFDAVTPLKDKRQVYRKTPLPTRASTSTSTPASKASEKLSIESLKFAGPAVQFQCSTPASRDRKTIRKTPYFKNAGGEDKDDKVLRDPTSPLDYFAQRSKEFSTLTPLRSGEAFRKSPYRRLLAASPKDISPAKLTGDNALTSPMSQASTISALTGVTGLTCTENQRELFPPVESHGNNSDDDDGNNEHSLKAGRKSVSSLIPKITEQEFFLGEVKQFSLDETNRAITALNGASFLRRESGDPSLHFSDAEAFKILRNVGFKRRRCKGVLLALVHWGRLARREETDTLGMCSRYFEAIPAGAAHQ